MIINDRLYKLLVLVGMGSITAACNFYIIYPTLRERRLLSLLKKLDEEGRVDEMKEVIKSPYLKNYTFEFKDEALATSQKD